MPSPLALAWRLPDAARQVRRHGACKTSEQARPLECRRIWFANRSGALVIPDVGTAASTSTVSDSAVPDALIVPASAPPVDAQNLAGNGIQVADSLASTWRRVGLAIERSGVATIQSRDEAARTYEISTVGKKTRSPGFFKKVFTLGMARDKSIKSAVALRVRVGGSDGESTVAVEGAAGEAGADAAAQVLDVLRQRMN
jgi:uncharacterized lipoprotein